MSHPPDPSPIRIGPHTLRNPVFLAPMSGVSDTVFRKLAWRFGAGMVVSEMVASEAWLTGQAEMELKSAAAGLPVHMVQLAGCEAHWMAQAARHAEANGADIIDINMGCPSKRVTNGQSGSALMRDLDHAAQLVRAVVGAVQVPVTLKMRLGWSPATINAPELARRAQDIGVAMITVHGRTRDQFYKGEADWRAVKAVRDAIQVPLLVNGDITNTEDAREAIAASGADGVMVGRASYGTPWLPGTIAAELTQTALPEIPSLADLVAEHYEGLVALYGPVLGVRNARKHIDWYSAHLDDRTHYLTERQAMLTGDDPKTVLAAIGRVFSEAPALASAA
ncbi:tRNA dihydrouridine synthase DusB [Rhizobiaceae bacterium]|nr:tRNA dihydrouridine synthase DusB [Rhizobiaceae bacterium]